MYIKYLNYVLRHKWFVFLSCCEAGFWYIWLGLIHDISKLRPSEFIPYAKYFYGKGSDEVEADFDLAWLLHQKRNKHHWQWWILPMDDGTTKVFDMPYKYLIEMICDWNGAGKAQKSTLTTLEWYEKNKEKIIISDKTKEKLLELLKREKLYLPE